MKKGISLHWKILIGLISGVVFGIVMTYFSWGKSFVLDWVSPFGKMFINSLKLIAVPLIFASLVKGVSDLKDISQLSKMGGITITIYIITTTIAVIIGLSLVNIIKPGNSVEQETREKLMVSYAQKSENIKLIAEQQKGKGPLNALEELIPQNIFKASSNNRNMLQVIFFAIFFGIGLILVKEEKTRTVKKFFDGLNDIVLKMIDLIMLVAPYGVFALLASLVVEAPSLDLFKALMWYSVAVVAGLMLLLLLYNVVVVTVTGKKPTFFSEGILPAQLLAFSTSSSAATLPVTMERVTEHMGVDEDVSSFVLPIGATINMDGTSLYQAVAAVFIAQVLGVDLSISAQIGIVLTATLASIGSAGVPGAGMVMLVIVLAQAGIPEAGLALIIAIDRPLDMMRTVVNITGDAMVSVLVDKTVRVRS